MEEKIAESTTVDNLRANSINSDEVYAGNMVVTGAARFANGFYGTPANSQNINTVSAQTTLDNNYYVIMSNGTNLIRVKYSDLIADLRSKLNG